MLDGRRVFNLDETGFFLYPKRGKVLARKCTRQVNSVIEGSDREMITVLFGSNALGDIVPSMVVLGRSRLPVSVRTNPPDGMVFSTSPTGWMKSEDFYDYFAVHFLPWVKRNNIPLPVIVFVDGHTSHLSLPLSEFCNQNQIILVALCPNATHILQPMDVGIFGPLKRKWVESRDKWTMENQSTTFGKTDFPFLLRTTLDSLAENQQIFLNAFRACGNTLLFNIFICFFCLILILQLQACSPLMPIQLIISS